MTDKDASRRKDLPAPALRALEEAAERRQNAVKTEAPKEIGGPTGAEPTRFGDWERAGRAVDF